MELDQNDNQTEDTKVENNSLLCGLTMKASNLEAIPFNFLDQTIHDEKVNEPSKIDSHTLESNIELDENADMSINSKVEFDDQENNETENIEVESDSLLSGLNIQRKCNFGFVFFYL